MDPEWADFRKYEQLPEAWIRFTEGPFWGVPILFVPAWYLNFLCFGGEDFLLWKDEALSTALSRMGFHRTEITRTQAPAPPPIARLCCSQNSSAESPKSTPKTTAQIDSDLMPPPPQPSSAPRKPDYSFLANMARDPFDKMSLLTAAQATAAAATGRGLRLQSEVDVGEPGTMLVGDLLTDYREAGRTTRP